MKQNRQLHWFTGSAVLLALLALPCIPSRAVAANGPATPTAQSAQEALKAAGAKGAYLLCLFYKQEGGDVTALSSRVAEFAGANGAAASWYKADVSIPANAQFAAQYGIPEQELPILLIFAPNGVITGGYQKDVTTEQLQSAISLSSLMLQVLEPLQEQKITIVCLQNASTQFNEESNAAVNQFASDPAYSQFVGVVKADPKSSGSAEFLQQCNLKSDMTEAAVVFLVPPGKIVKTLTGKISKKDLWGALSACTAGSGCCPGGKR